MLSWIGRRWSAPLALASICCCAFGWAADHEEGEFRLSRPREVVWSPGPPSLPAGAQWVVLEGDPTKEGPFVMRVKVPDGYRIPPHTHPKTERVTILAGVFHLGMGARVDDNRSMPLPAGSYGYWKAGMKHFVRAEGETIVQFHGQGPWTIEYLDPRDDPRQAKPAAPSKPPQE